MPSSSERPSCRITAKMTFCGKCLNGALADAEVALTHAMVTVTGTPIGHSSVRRGLCRGIIVNLNQFRKKRRRAEAEAQAKENRARFGRSKEERTAESRERERAKKEIENKRLD